MGLWLGLRALKNLYFYFSRVIEITLHFVTVKQCLSASIEGDLFYPVKKSEIVEKANQYGETTGRASLYLKKKH